MTTSLLDLALSLLLTTAASIGHAAPAAQFGQAEVMDTRPPIRVEAAVTRRQAPAARAVPRLIRSIDYAATSAIERARRVVQDDHGRLGAALDTALRWLVVTPDMHRVHHSIERHEHDSNYGFNLSVWDLSLIHI